MLALPMPTLARCPSCSTHIRTGEDACPFCGVALAAVPSAPSRLLAAVKLASVLAITACAYGLPPPKMDAGHPTDSHAASDVGPTTDAPPVDAH